MSYKKTIVTSLLSFVINGLVFFFLFGSLKHAAYERLADSVELLLLTIASVGAFVAILNIDNLRYDIKILIFFFFLILGLCLFYTAALIIKGYNGLTIQIIINLVVIVLTSILIFQKLRSAPTKNSI